MTMTRDYNNNSYSKYAMNDTTNNKYNNNANNSDVQVLRVAINYDDDNTLML